MNPVDLQADATWNLCPKEQDEITGIAKIRHGKDCYSEKRNKGFLRNPVSYRRSY